MANRNIAHAVRVALVTAGAVSAGLYGVTGFAQEQLTEIVITGSRIKVSSEAETSQPVTVISRDDIETQGFQSVVDILQNITATGTPPLSRSSPLSAGENAGGSYISLRNLGASRTLILLNGRRLPVSTSGLADVSLIPASAIERVEVLKDGASSIYGSDAIAGVINIITRTNFDGFTATAYVSQYEEGDGETERIEFIMGTAGDKGSVTVSGEWVSEGEVWAKDRPYSAFARSSLHPNDGWTTVGQYGGWVTTATTAVPGLATGTRVVLSDGANPLLIGSYRAQNVVTGGCSATPSASQGGVGATINGCVPGQAADKSNTNEQTHLRTPLDRSSLNIDGVYDLTDEVRIRTNLLYSQRTTERQVAGYPYQAAPFATPMSATSYFNPTGATISNWWRRSWEVPRVSDSKLTTFGVSATLEGSFQAASRDFDWDVTYQHAVNNQLQSTFGNENVPRVLAAVGPSFLNAQGQVQCGTAAAPIAFTTCVPWNPFLPYGRVGPGGLTDNLALQDFLFQEEHAKGKTTTTVMSGNLTGTIVKLPAGDLAFALGVERREELGQFVPDALAVTGTSTNLAAGPTRGGYEVDEVYAELRVPLLADTFLAHRLNLNLASRYSDYDTFGDTTNSKIGLEWAPLPQLLFRGTWAEGFRAPTIADLFGGGSQTFSFFTDPCDTLFGSSATNTTTRANCVAAMGPLANTYRQLAQGFVPAGSPNAQTPVAFTSGSNPTLQPESSVTKTAGFVWSPEFEFLRGMNMAFDWWHVRIDDTIVADSPTTILNDCYVQGLASRCSPQLFTRDPTLGYVDFMRFGGRNAGYREVEGYDLTLSYAFKSAFGDFNISSTTTYTEKDVLISTNDPRFPVSSVGTASSAGSVWRVRSNLNIGWQYGDFGATWGLRYYSPLEEGCAYAFIDPANPSDTTPNLECNSIKMRPTGAFNSDGTPALALSRRNDSGANTFNDVQLRWSAPWDATIAIGANNVFDNTGPVMYSQPNANVSYNGAYDLDRTFYAKYTQRF